MGDHAPGLPDVVLRAVDNIVGSLSRETDDDRLLDVNGRDALGDSEGRNDRGEETHVGFLGWIECLRRR